MSKATPKGGISKRSGQNEQSDPKGGISKRSKAKRVK